MEQTTAEVVAGARLAEDAGLALGEIEKVSNDLADLIQSISEAARQQSAAATNISATMNVIQEITTQTSVRVRARRRSRSATWRSSPPTCVVRSPTSSCRAERGTTG